MRKGDAPVIGIEMSHESLQCGHAAILCVRPLSIKRNPLCCRALGLSLGGQLSQSKNPVPLTHGNKIDPMGRNVFLKGSIAGQIYTFATIYAPNTNQLTFIDTALEQLAEFKEGLLILGGDFKIRPDPLLDTSHTRP